MKGISEEALSGFMSRFFGYGSFSAPYWFVGMEEGGCDSVDALARRIDAWKVRSCRDLEDLGEYHQALGVTQWFGPGAKLQSTWSQLCRIACAAEGRETNADAVRAYQAKRLGRTRGETCLLELLPLPAPSTSVWPYTSIGSLPFLGSRDEYCAELLPSRLDRIGHWISEHRPKAVTFYSFNYLDHWAELATTGFEERHVEGKRVLLGRRGGTALVVVSHPASRGTTNAYYEAVGGLIRSDKVLDARRA